MVARDTLPAELGDDGVDDVLHRFRQWLEGFRPGVERDHGYLTSDLSFTPEDPTARWSAQLDALNAAGQGYAGLSPGERRHRLRSAIQAALADRRRQLTAPRPWETTDSGEDNPLLSTADAIRAPHVALALLAFFFSSADATDLCYRVPIGPQTCRELGRATMRPG